MSNGWLLTGFTALIGLATIAVLVSQRAQTSNVIQAVGAGVGSAIGAAVSPVTGGDK